MQTSFEALYTRAAPYAKAAITLIGFTTDLIGDSKHISARRHANFLAMAKIVEAMLRRICLLLIAHVTPGAPKRKVTGAGFPEGLTLKQATGYRLQLLETAPPHPVSPAAYPLQEARAPDAADAAPSARAEDEALRPAAPLLIYLLDLEIALINPVKTAKKLKRKLAARALAIDSALLNAAAVKRLKHGLLFAGDAAMLTDLNRAAREALPLKYYPVVPYEDSS